MAEGLACDDDDEDDDDDDDEMLVAVIVAMMMISASSLKNMPVHFARISTKTRVEEC